MVASLGLMPTSNCCARSAMPYCVARIRRNGSGCCSQTWLTHSLRLPSPAPTLSTSLGVITKKRGLAIPTHPSPDREFLKPNFDAKGQVGVRAVGMYATADKPQVVVNAQLEGDDA